MPSGRRHRPDARERDTPTKTAAGPAAESENVPSLVGLAIAHMTQGRDDEAVRVLEQVHEYGRPRPWWRCSHWPDFCGNETRGSGRLQHRECVDVSLPEWPAAARAR